MSYVITQIKLQLDYIDNMLNNPDAPKISEADYHHLRRQAFHYEKELLRLSAEIPDKDRDIELANEIIEKIEALEMFLKGLFVGLLAKQLLDVFRTPFNALDLTK